MFLQGEFISEVDFVRYESMLNSAAYVMCMTHYCECYCEFDNEDECFKLHVAFYGESYSLDEWCIAVEISTLKYSNYREVIDNVLHRIEVARKHLIGE